MISSSFKETLEQGKLLGKSLKRNSIVALFGELGVGKTVFIKGLIEGISTISPEEVNSPTFNYLNIYPSEIPIFHFDLYRLRDEKEFLMLGFDEYFETEGICCIEWAERIISILPQKSILIEISHLKPDKYHEIQSVEMNQNQISNLPLCNYREIIYKQIETCNFEHVKASRFNDCNSIHID